MTKLSSLKNFKEVWPEEKQFNAHYPNDCRCQKCTDMHAHNEALSKTSSVEIGVDVEAMAKMFSELPNYDDTEVFEKKSGL